MRSVSVPLFASVFAVMVLFLFSGLVLLLPFLAQSIQNLSPILYVNLYVNHLNIFAVSFSILLAFPLAVMVYKKSKTERWLVGSLAILFLIVTLLAVIIYLNFDFLNDLMLRPSYE